MSGIAAAITASAVIGGYSAHQSNKLAKSAKGSAEYEARLQREIAQQQGEEIKEAGKKAAGQITTAGQSTPEEQARLSRYKGKATTPAEQLMTEAGPISQAVARRVQERVDQPGMDYDVNSADFEKSVGTPVWASLKARGITPAPGDTTGGGLGTTQYMKSVVPYLASLRSGQINTDIARGQEYGTQAQNLQNYYTDLENQLGEAIRSRLYESGIKAAGAEQTGITAGGQTIAGGASDAASTLSNLYANQLAGANAQGAESGDALANALSAFLMYQGSKTPSTSGTSGTSGAANYGDTSYNLKSSPLYQKRVAGNSGVYYGR